MPDDPSNWPLGGKVAPTDPGAEYAPERESEQLPAKIEIEEVLGAIHMGYGNSIEKNIDKGVFWLRRGADKGNQYCQFALGDLYEKGVGVKQDREKARELYRQASAGPRVVRARITSAAAGRLLALEKDQLELQKPPSTARDTGSR